MEGLWLDQNLTVNASTVYANKIGEAQKLVGKDVEVTLPEVRNLTVDATAMGTITVPVIGQIENMEATIHHIGVDEGLAHMVPQETIQLEYRFVQQVMKNDGSQGISACKAFLTGFPEVAVPEISVVSGEAVDSEIPYTITRYEMIADGVQLWMIDRLNQHMIINGVDYYADLTSAL